MKSFKRLIVSVVALSLTISLTGCGIIRQMMSILNGDYSEEPSRSEPTAHEEVTGVIGKDGGVIEDEESNVRISIPQGALSEETTITAQYVEEPSLMSNQVQSGFLAAVEFGPSGTAFEKPVEVSLQLAKTPINSELSVFCYNESERVWEYVTDATVQYGSIAKFSVAHFSSYQIVDRTKDFLNEWTNIVKHAKANGLSDTEAIEAFRDYLVNDKHIMDYYEQFDGYWYEPCGLKLNGKYQVNGEQGDPNQLYHSEGESNKVGDKYGLSKIDGGISTKDKVKNASSNSEVYDITVIVEYKLIKPDIELSTTKKNLKKGESTTINIRCHYTNVANYFDQFKDIEMSNYMLTISKPTNFTTDKSAVLTDGNGEASFVVTAKENDKAETITVNFDVSGSFGVHAEGNVTLNSEGYHVSGHVKEEKEFVFNSNTPTELSIVTTQNGSFKIIVEYDFEGDISEDDGQLTGSLSFMNFTASLSSSPWKGYASNEDFVAYYTFDIYTSLGTVESLNPSFNITGEKSMDNQCITYINGDSKNIGVINGDGYLDTLILGGDSDEYRQDHTFKLTISSNISALLNFVLEPGTQNNSSSAFKDDYKETFYIGGTETTLLSGWGFSYSSETSLTTQTITIS